MTDQTTSVMLNLNAGPEADAEELERLTRQLRQELLELDVDQVDLVRAGQLPEGAKAGDPIAWGELLLTLAASGGVLSTMIAAVQGWLTRQGQSSITLRIGKDELIITGKLAEQQQSLVDAWIARHGKAK